VCGVPQRLRNPEPTQFYSDGEATCLRSLSSYLSTLTSAVLAPHATKPKKQFRYQNLPCAQPATFFDPTCRIFSLLILALRDALLFPVAAISSSPGCCAYMHRYHSFTAAGLHSVLLRFSFYNYVRRYLNISSLYSSVMTPMCCYSTNVCKVWMAKFTIFRPARMLKL
jgi:hypothetical protein